MRSITIVGKITSPHHLSLVQLRFLYLGCKLVKIAILVDFFIWLNFLASISARYDERLLW